MSHSKQQEIDRAVVLEVGKIVSEMSGIQLGEKQYSMVENRLKSRLLKLQLKTFQDYLAYLKRHKESESQALLSLMTTHHTFFFREFSHFEFLLNKVLSPMIHLARGRADKTIRMWSAACSRGQEVYSLAMFMNFHLKHMAPDVKYEIWGTDIDPESVERAKNAVYKSEEIKQSPAMYVDGHWIRGQGSAFGFVKAKDHLKANCHFTTANLQAPQSFLNGKKFDIIFCRNVYIYFNQDQIKQITKSMLSHLDVSGFLFLGVSETLQGLGLDVNLIGTSVYQQKKAALQKPTMTEPIVPLAPQIPKMLNVLCVDDSKTILAILKKILTPDTGFRVAATAENGLLALEEMKKQKFDLITLDLHMPELDGVGFLKQKPADAPPVLVVSSINRDDVTIAQKAIQSGAADYVEKPSLENVAQAGNEIRSKLKTIWQMQQAKNLASAGHLTSNSNSAKSSIAIRIESKKIKVLVVDDSAVIRQLLEKIINSDPGMEVVASAEKPSLVEDLIRKHKPDVMTCDINMPEMTGVELVKKLFPIYKISTIMISSLSREDGPMVMQALENGAIDYIQKPDKANLAQVSQMIRDRIKTAALAKVVNLSSSKRKVVSQKISGKETLVVMGSSTGGTEALRVVLESLPSEIPPILIVQHIPAVFSEAFANRMNNLVNFEVKEAKDGDEIRKNRVLIAPGGCQMGIKVLSGKLVVSVNQDAPVNRHKPSVDYLFQTASQFKFKNLIAVILTGMGSDGARQMKVLRNSGARTVAQDESTSVVFGMPREAIQLGAAEFVLPIGQIAQKVIDLVEDEKASVKANSKERAA